MEVQYIVPPTPKQLLPTGAEESWATMCNWDHTETPGCVRWGTQQQFQCSRTHLLRAETAPTAKLCTQRHLHRICSAEKPIRTARIIISPSSYVYLSASHPSNFHRQWEHLHIPYDELRWHHLPCRLPTSLSSAKSVPWPWIYLSAHATHPSSGTFPTSQCNLHWFSPWANRHSNQSWLRNTVSPLGG